MSQLSLFSADLTPPQLVDLGGLLAAHGQLTSGPDGVRLSILLAEPWRAAALLRECRVRDIAAVIPAPSPVSSTAEPAAGPVILLQTDRTPLLAGLAAQWTRGAVKSVPADIVLGPGFLRCWTLAAGHPADVGFVLGLDPHAPDTHAALASAMMRVGIAPTLIGTRGSHPALRISGRRRLSRLVENVGEPPGSVEAFEQWPRI